MESENKYLNIARGIILKCIDKEKVKVFLFGSRADKNSRGSSDMDIGFLSKEKLDAKFFSRISEALEESIVPYHFDLVDFSKVNENFKKIASQKIEIWNKAKDISIN